MPDRNPPTLVELKTMFHCEDEASEESTWSNVMTWNYLWRNYEIIFCVAAWKVDKIFSKNSGFIILSPSPDVYGTYSPDWSPVAHFSKSNPSWPEQEKQESMRKYSLMTVCFCRALQFSVILALLVAYYLQRYVTTSGALPSYRRRTRFSTITDVNHRLCNCFRLNGNFHSVCFANGTFTNTVLAYHAFVFFSGQCNQSLWSFLPIQVAVPS